MLVFEKIHCLTVTAITNANHTHTHHTYIIVYTHTQSQRRENEQVGSRRTTLTTVFTKGQLSRGLTICNYTGRALHCSSFGAQLQHNTD